MSGLHERTQTRTRNFRFNGTSRSRPHVERPDIAPGDVQLPDKSVITAKQFHEMRSQAHQLMPRDDFDVCHARVRAALSDRQWNPIRAWIHQHIGGNGSVIRRENTLVALLLGHAAKREDTSALIILDRIRSSRSAKGTLTPE